MLKEGEFEVSESMLEVWMTKKAAAKHELMVKAEMLREYKRFVDSLTGELNTTRLAEHVAVTFDLYADYLDMPVPVNVFEWAFDVEQELIKAGEVEKP